MNKNQKIYTFNRIKTVWHLEMQKNQYSSNKNVCNNPLLLLFQKSGPISWTCVYLQVSKLSVGRVGLVPPFYVESKLKNSNTSQACLNPPTRSGPTENLPFKAINFSIFGILNTFSNSFFLRQGPTFAREGVKNLISLIF